MKILLVNPASTDTFWGLKNSLKFISKKAILPPLGLLTVAAILPANWDKRLVDMATAKLHDRDIFWADYVFISAMAIQAESARGVIERCKKLAKPIVAGGPLFTAAPEDYDDVDHLVLNEAEITLPVFLEELKNGSAKHIYKSDKWTDMQDSPNPLWHLAKKNHYAVMPIQYSRGCPFNCDFCNVTVLFGRNIRTKTAGQILAELESLYSLGWRGPVFFVDDNFIAGRKKLKTEILPALISWMKKRKYPFSFNTQCSVNLADDEQLMRLMAQAGFDCVFIGIETVDEQSLIECNKVQNQDRNLVESVRKIQRFGMEVQGGFILGFDSDKASVFDNLTGFIEKSGIVTAMVGLLNAPRGTRLHQRLRNENRLLKDSSGDNTDFSTNFIPMMGRRELIEGYQKVVGTIYSNKFYYERVLRFLKNYRPLPKSGPGRGFSGFKALVKSIWHLGILSKGRVYYWKLLLWSLAHPKYLDKSIRLAIYGFHFRKVFADCVSPMTNQTP